MSSLNGWKAWILKDPRFEATNFLSNFIFPSYLLVYPEIVMCLAYTSKKCEFWRPHLRGTPLWYSQILSNFIFSYLPILKNFISPGWVVKFWVLASLFEEDSFILVPQNFVNFYLYFIFAYPENLMCLSWVVKKLEFWRPCLGGTPILIYPNFVKIYLFFTFVNPKNLMCPACVVKKFDFWQPHLRGTLHFDTPNCFKIYVSLIFTYFKNFICPALKVKKFEFWRSPPFGGNPLFWNA